MEEFELFKETFDLDHALINFIAKVVNKDLCDGLVSVEDGRDEGLEVCESPLVGSRSEVVVGDFNRVHVHQVCSLSKAVVFKLRELSLNERGLIEAMSKEVEVV